MSELSNRSLETRTKDIGTDINDFDPDKRVEITNRLDSVRSDFDPDKRVTSDVDGQGIEIQDAGKEDLKTNDLGTNQYRELTSEEKQSFKSKLGWPDDQFKKCTIDKQGVIQFRTDRCDLENKTAENGVPYRRKLIDIYGVKIEGVFPVFDSKFDVQLEPENYRTRTYAKECNAVLQERVNEDPKLRSEFSNDQLKEIEDGTTPTGYVWHHNEEPGKMQLVKAEDHDRTRGGAAHTGGNSLWGANSVDTGRTGEIF